MRFVKPSYLDNKLFDFLLPVVGLSGIVLRKLSVPFFILSNPSSIFEGDELLMDGGIALYNLGPT